MTPHAAAVAERLEALRERMGAAVDTVDLLAITKGHPIDAAAAALEIGLNQLGENYAQELRGKAEKLGDAPTWHFVGQLQSNKVRMIADHVAVWQSVDRLKVGREIAKRAPGATVFAQANLAADANKAGCSLDEIDAHIEALQELDLAVTGVMGVGTADDLEETRAGFRRLRATADRWSLPHCSMGMTADLEIAIDEGSTMIRVGTALFGPRPAPSATPPQHEMP